MDIPSWSFTNIGKSMLPPEITHFDKIEELPTKTPIGECVLIEESNPPETITIFDKIEEFLYNYIDLGFDLNLKLFIELYI